jgi:hypothetical protein
MELSGLPIKYHSSREMSDALGINDQAMDQMLYRLRKRLNYKMCYDQK